MNRSTIYEYLRKETELEHRATRVGKGTYPVMRVPYDWEISFLLINDSMITGFQAIILFSTELCVRFAMYGDDQVNIPYKDIKSLEVREDLEVGYIEKNKRWKPYQ